MALGVLRGDVLQLVYRSTVASVLGGISSGIILSNALNQLLRHWLAGAMSRGISPLLTALGILIVAAAVASSIPALRATRIEPMDAIRYE